MMKQHLEFLEAFKKMQKEFVEKGKQEFTKICQDFFAETPQVKVIKWRAYTPWFNDGDVCTFSVYEPTFSNSPDPSIVYQYGEIDSEDESLWAAEAYGIVDEATKENCKIFAKIIQSNEFEPVMLALFGDHVEVTVTAEGITSREYEHD